RIDEFIEPRAEITIASVIHVAVPWPITRASTSDATCCEFAISLNGSTFRHAALNNIYTSATNATPPTSARGKFCCGSATSDPTRFKSSQPSYAHSAAASAQRNAVSSPAFTADGQMGSPACVALPGSRNATPITITTLTTLIAVRNTCTLPPNRTPRESTPVIINSENTAKGCAQVNTKSYGGIHCVSLGMAMCTVKMGAATAGRKNARKRIIPAAIDAADDGLPTIECIHPNKYPHTGPNPRRRYAYSPPASGI